MEVCKAVSGILDCGCGGQTAVSVEWVPEVEYPPCGGSSIRPGSFGWAGSFVFCTARRLCEAKRAKSTVLKREGLLASEDETVELIAKDWISRRVIANISSKEIEVEKEDLNKVGDGLMPVYT